MDEKKTAGQQLLDHSSKPQSYQMVSVIELQQEMLKQDEFSTKMLNYIEQGRKKYETDFYIVMNLKREKLLDLSGVLQAPRTISELKRSCPTPFYDQSVWRYHYFKEALEYLWTVPDKDTCEYYKYHALQVVPEERELLNYVLSYYDGTLLNRAKQLNGEKKDAPSIILSVVKE